jgi:hypothetical protein
MQTASRQKTLIVTLGLCVLGACAEDNLTRVGPPTPQAQSMDRALADVNRIRAYVYGGGAREDTAAAATDLEAWARDLPAVFPPGTAAKYVDMSTPQAAQASQAMARTTRDLSAAGASGDRAAVGEALGQVERQGCGACHLHVAQ